MTDDSKVAPAAATRAERIHLRGASVDRGRATVFLAADRTPTVEGQIRE